MQFGPKTGRPSTINAIVENQNETEPSETRRDGILTRRGFTSTPIGIPPGSSLRLGVPDPRGTQQVNRRPSFSDFAPFPQ